MKELISQGYLDFICQLYHKQTITFYTAVGLPMYLSEAVEDGLCQVIEIRPSNYEVKITPLGKERAKQLALIYKL